jgi:hypothetical protein
VESSDRHWIRDIVRFTTIAIAATAVVRELRKPAELREWHGSVGLVPYDFRRPTLERLRARWWAPDQPLIQPQPFGVGWTLNLGKIVASLRSRTD